MPFRKRDLIFLREESHWPGAAASRYRIAQKFCMPASPHSIAEDASELDLAVEIFETPHHGRRAPGHRRRVDHQQNRAPYPLSHFGRRASLADRVAPVEKSHDT